MKNFYRDSGLIVVVSCLIIILFILTGYIYSTEMHFFWMIAPFVVLVSGFCIGKLITVTRKTFHYFAFASDEIDTADKRSLYHLPLSVAIIDSEYNFIWYNKSFMEKFTDEAVYGNPVSMIADIDITRLINGEDIEISHGESFYKVYVSVPPETEQPNIHVVYFEDITLQTLHKIEQWLSQPVVMLISIDSYNEMFEGALESERARVMVKIDELLEEFTASTTGIMKKTNRDRIWAVIEYRHVEQLIESKVKLLDKAREIAVTDRINVTLSIGIGATASTISQSERFARQALEMAQGRGGDQAALKTANGFEFFGGVSKGIERQNKVKARIIANSLADLIENSDRVYIMGHKSGDLDSVGSSIGLACLIRNLGKEALIAVDYYTVLCTELIDKFRTSEEKKLGTEDNRFYGLFITPARAREMLTDDSLLIITDTHIPHILEDEQLYRQAKKVMVIDHHRKMVSHIDNALIFFHESHASSASEMVTELLPCFGDAGKLSPQQAEALLSGIMLDTKNFTVKTGVRTFEAAAFLRKLGADTISVKSLFSNSFDSYKKKISLVSSASVYKKCAIAYSNDFSEAMRLVAPQAADEMLGITGVAASFVVFRSKQDEVSVSARSLGAVNVQLIMEHIGGGGHHTMAGAQFQNAGIDEATDKLIKSIDKFFELNGGTS